MRGIFITIFSILLFFFFYNLILGSINVIVTGGAILFFFVFLVVYSILYFITLRIFKSKVPGPIKFLLFILTIVVFYSYFTLEGYIQEVNEKKRLAQYKSLFLGVLQDVPPNADVWADYNRFYASTGNLKDKEGKQPTFKWGDFELTLLDSSYSAREAKAVSLTQPKLLPNGIKCGAELHFSRKQPDDVEDGFSPKFFQFYHCNVDKLSFRLNRQEIQLNNATLYYKNDTEKGYEPEWIELVKQAAAQLNLSEYWFTRLNGQAKIEKEWRASDIGVIFDSMATPVALAVGAQHPTGLGNMKLKKCFMQSSLSLMVLTNLQDENPTLLTDGLVNKSLSPDCPSKIKVALSYYVDGFEEQSSIKELLGNDFSHINNDVYINWNNNRLYSLGSEYDNHPFFWGKLEIKKFKIAEKGKGAIVYFSNNSPMKMGDFTCREAYFKHNNKPSNNSLSYGNFTLVKCGIDDGIILIKNHPIRINKSNLSYFYSNEKSFQKASDFIEVENSQVPQIKSEILKLELMEFSPILNIANNQLYLKQAVINTQGETIALLGEIKAMNPGEKLTLGKCKYDNYSLKLILKNFSDNDVDVSISSEDTVRPVTLINTENADLCQNIQKQPYYLLSEN
ncbi:hypothetical protein HYE55_10855 [Aggregatibacter actinomycetemcomitans]|uniref:hypothetical protein n=1 Tax=Aggregatibacter actinomycetemcomitans TaxID=714 RepID=UPI00197C5097|nr:hypothetical protein [Aggregatibacter actinomycetemcomitans]MBN6082525.1 hypothetical protein [Aggregatibacter actinomycetemcomitans]